MTDLSPKLKKAIEEELTKFEVELRGPVYANTFSLICILAKGERIPEAETLNRLNLIVIHDLMKKGLITKIFVLGGSYFILNPNFENKIHGLEPIVEEPLRVSKALALEVMNEILGNKYSNGVVENTAEVIARTIDATRNYNASLDFKKPEYIAVIERYVPFVEKNILIRLEDDKGERVILHPSFVAKCRIKSNKS